MFNREIEAVLSLMAFTIFADKRVFGDEIETLIASAKTLHATDRCDIPITEAKVLLWFEMNRMRLREKMNLGPAGLKRWLEHIMEELTDFPDKPLILDLIKHIAQSDGEYHVSEKALSILVEEKLGLASGS